MREANARAEFDQPAASAGHSVLGRCRDVRRRAKQAHIASGSEAAVKRRLIFGSASR